MKRENNYRLDRVRKVSVFPDTMLEGKIELVSERNSNVRKYVYLVFDIEEADRDITEDTDYWCYFFPFDEMYDNTGFIYDMEQETAILLMKQMQEEWERGNGGRNYR